MHRGRRGKKKKKEDRSRGAMVKDGEKKGKRGRRTCREEWGIRVPRNEGRRRKKTIIRGPKFQIPCFK